MVGCKLDNQMNFGNPPFINKDTKLVCVNGSHEELEYNIGADIHLLSDPGAFNELIKMNHSWDAWFDLQRQRRADWVSQWVEHIEKETVDDLKLDRKMHPLQLALDVQSMMKDGDWLVLMEVTRIFGMKLLQILQRREVENSAAYFIQGIIAFWACVSFALSAKAQSTKMLF